MSENGSVGEDKVEVIARYEGEDENLPESPDGKFILHTTSGNISSIIKIIYKK